MKSIADKNKLKTPYFLVDEALVRRNLEILQDVSVKSGCKILLAQKHIRCTTAILF